MKKLNLTLTILVMTVSLAFSQTDSLPTITIKDTTYFLLNQAQARTCAWKLITLEQCQENEESYKREIETLRKIGATQEQRVSIMQQDMLKCEEMTVTLRDALDVSQKALKQQERNAKMLKITRNVGIPVSFGLGVYCTYSFLKNFPNFL